MNLYAMITTRKDVVKEEQEAFQLGVSLVYDYNDTRKIVAELRHVLER
jgi:hypothetical protein